VTNNLGRYFDLRRCNPMTRAEEHDCASEYVKTRDPALAERLIRANMRLVVKIARSYRPANCDTVDLVQAGNVGLINAVLRFDPHRGVKLCSYAAWWIRAYILKFTIDNWRLVKTGTTQSQRKLFFSLNKQQAKLEQSGVRADAKRLSSMLAVEEKDVISMLERFSGDDVSLDTPRRSSLPDTRALEESLSSPSVQRPDVRVEASNFAHVLQRKLRLFGDSLRGREVAIFQRRLLSEEPVQLTLLATGFGVSSERVRQLESRLKTRIRDYLKVEMGDALVSGGLAA
jgi:RNA polymerase sigma-32 factor